MNEEFETVFDALRRAGLSADEKNVIRIRLSSFAHAHPASVPFVIRALDSATAFAARFALPQSLFARSFASALGLLFVVGIGTSYAAEGTLPGDFLYPVKIHVDEGIEGAVAFSANAQAEWNAQLAARRLGEAEALAAQKKLTPAVESSLASALDQATRNFDQDVARISQSVGNAGAVADAQSDMEATLSANADVLGRLTDAVPQSQSTIAPLLLQVQNQAVAIGNAEAQSDEVAVSAGSYVKAAAATEKSDAEGQISAARALVAEVQSTTTAPAAAETFDAEQAIGAGEVKFNQGNYGAALTTFQAASQAAQEAQVHVDAAIQLKNDAGVSLPDSTSSIDSVSATSSSATTSLPAATSIELDANF